MKSGLPDFGKSTENWLLLLFIQLACLALATWAMQCYHCSDPRDCKRNPFRTVDCIYDNVMCGMWTLREVSYSLAGKKGDIVRRDCFYDNFEREGCERRGKLERCICRGDLCNIPEMPEKVKNKTRILKSLGRGLFNGDDDDEDETQVTTPPETTPLPVTESTTVLTTTVETAPSGGTSIMPTETPLTTESVGVTQSQIMALLPSDSHRFPGNVGCFYCESVKDCEVNKRALTRCMANDVPCATWTWMKASADGLGNPGDVNRRSCYYGKYDEIGCIEKMHGLIKVCLCQGDLCNRPENGTGA